MQMLTYVIVNRNNPNEILWWGNEMGWGSYSRCTKIKDAEAAFSLATKVEGTPVPLNEDEIALLNVLAASAGLNGLLV